MTSSARILVAVAAFAIATGVVFAMGGVLFYRATLPDAQTHLYPASRAVTAWATRWPRDDGSLLERSAVATADAVSPPVLAGSVLVALGSDRRLHALDPRTGAQRWEVGYGDGRRVVGFRVAGSLLLLVVMRPNQATGLADTSLVAVDSGTRAVLWDRPLDADVFPASIQVGASAAYLVVADSVDGGEYTSLRERGFSVSLHPRVRAYALSDGAERWERALPDRADAAPLARVAITLSGAQVVVSTGSSFAPIGMSVLDAATGRALWQASDGTEALGMFRAELVVRSGTDLALFAVNTGRVLARLVAMGARSGPAVVARDVLYQFASDHVVAVDLATRRALWTTALDSPHGGFGSPGGRTRPPAVQDDHLYVGGRDEDVYSIDVRTGAVEWKFPAELDAGTSASAAPLRYGSLMLVQDDQLTAYRVPG
ncbi:MAG TPA: PQQ-binding-like beta-propeller repeat protein [Candidatus Dormibacteraeota bacterium]